MFFLLALLTIGRAQTNCSATQITNATLAPRVAVAPTATLTLSVNVTGFGVTRVTESGSDDDVAMEFSNLTLIVPLKGEPLSSTRLPNETAQASVALAAPAVCDLREWGTAGRITPIVARVLVNRTTVDLLVLSAVERIPFATWSGPLLALRVTAFERDASQNDCRYYSGDDDLANVTFTNQLCAVENAVCATTIGANMDGWQAAGLFEFRLAPSWTLSGSRRSLVLAASAFLDVPPLPSVVATRTISAPYEFVAVDLTAGAGLRFHVDGNGNLVRHLHSGSLVLASAGSVVQLKFDVPFNASRNVDRRVAEGIYNVSLVPLMRARQVQLFDCLQLALELEGAGAEWSLVAYGFALALPDQVSLWFVIGSTLTTTTTTTTASTTTTTASTTTTAVPVTTRPATSRVTPASTTTTTTTTTTSALTTTTPVTARVTTTSTGQQGSQTTTSAAPTSAISPQTAATTAATMGETTTSVQTAVVTSAASAQASGSPQTGTAIEAADDNSAAIIGGAVGASVGLLVIGVVVAALWYRRRASPPATNETAMQSQSAVAPSLARQEYGPSPVFAPSPYGPGPAEAPGSVYAASAVDFKITESASYGAFSELEQGQR